MAILEGLRCCLKQGGDIQTDRTFLEVQTLILQGRCAPVCSSHLQEEGFYSGYNDLSPRAFARGIGHIHSQILSECSSNSDRCIYRGVVKVFLNIISHARCRSLLLREEKKTDFPQISCGAIFFQKHTLNDSFAVSCMLFFHESN